MRENRARRLQSDPAGVREAAALLRAGALVAFPTETVYGLGADARDDSATAAIFEAKDRPTFNPLIVHVTGRAAAAALAIFPTGAERLAAAFWPGPLTLALPSRPGTPVSPLARAGLDSIALRAPAHPLAQALLAAFDGPIAAPSANPSGRISPTTAAHVLEGLGERIAAVIDGGPCSVGVESTIVGFIGGRPALLRPGGLPVEEIEAALGSPLARPQASSDAPIHAPNAPGQLSSHYAPGAALRLNAARPAPDESWLGFGPDPAGVSGPAANLSPTGDLREAAAHLFRDLRALDTATGGAGRIAVSPIPDHGLGLAINDRLRRAAAPRT